MIVNGMMAVQHKAASEGFKPALQARAAGWLAVLATWRRRRHARAELARMSRHLLKDIGLEPAEAWAEMAKPFWRA